MQNPIAWLVCSNSNEKYNRIEIFKDSKILIGLNDNEMFEIQQDKVSFMIGIIEHKFNSFILQSVSNCCHYRGKRMKRDEIIILNENDLVRFWYCQDVWEYKLVFAKASTSKSKDSKIKRMIMDDNCFLKDALKCGICWDVYQKPVQIQCKHCFCGHCMTKWVHKSSNCPTCRQEIITVTNVQALDKLSILYLRKYPEKAKPKELQQLYDQDNRYYYEYDVKYLNLNRFPRQQQDEDPMSDISLDELEQLLIDDIVPQNQQQLIQTECKSCQQEYNQYICQPDQEHVYCCNYRLPRRQLNARENAKYQLFCQICKKYTCKYYYNNDCYTLQILHMERWSQVIMSFYKKFMPEFLLIKIQECLKGVPIDYIFNYVMHNCVIKEQFYLEGQQKWRISNQNELILRGSPICLECMREVYPQMVIKFFELNRIPSIIPNCQNGIYCQLLTQNYNDHHNNYNHLCRRQI